ncbi:HU family DNA-binding protein [Pseudooceanicola sp. C21-150M6]|uniref:HU family DNA-binding protein n=1 Tax=Pseudooceanicola sp. C21-150M6 TaxID=3434355 RepID=UPI003D7F9D07
MTIKKDTSGQPEDTGGQAESKPKLQEAAIAAAPAVKPTLVTLSSPDPQSEPLKNKELLDAAAERSGIKRGEAKPAIEAALAIIGESLAEGRDVDLPGLGKVKIKRVKTLSGRRIVELRLRQKTE